jgi:hypothetical protein
MNRKKLELEIALRYIEENDKVNMDKVLREIRGHISQALHDEAEFATIPITLAAIFGYVLDTSYFGTFTPKNKAQKLKNLS